MAVMDRDRWRELAPLLDQALELVDAERASWLAALRARSPELAAELGKLLAGEARADRDRFLAGALHPTPADSVLAAYLQRALGDAYAVERELDGGAMSRVFIAREHALGRTVVIKVLPPLFAASIRAERFAREVRVAAALQHPNIVPLFTAGEAGGLPYYVMPYVQGESLRTRLVRHGRLPLADALSVLRDVARALAFAHEHGIVHRDVKPENVLLAGDAAVVTDFGIAKAMAAAGEDEHARDGGDTSADPRTLSAIGLTLGTPAYIAPEQVGDPGVDHRADLYAWGILAYELLAGEHPFAGRTTWHELVAAQLGETPAPLTRAAPEVTPAVVSLVRRCLEKDPSQRPQSAREILDTLAVVATAAAGESDRRWRVRPLISRALLAGGSLVAVALAAAVLTMRRDSRNGSAPGPPSLAVLPLEGVGGDTANAYFGDGMADEIATALSKAGGLRVASPTSVAAFRSTHTVDVRELGRRLGVSTVLEGHVRRAGGRMRITVQLTSVDDGMALWSEEYEREVRDVFHVQDEIARSIVGALRARLPVADGALSARAMASPATTSAEAYDLYLRGNYLLERRGAGVAKAVEYFERAIAKDSSFARAYAGLAYALELLPTFASSTPAVVERRAIDAARHALALDSTLAEAYTALALAHSLALRWRDAGEAFARADAAGTAFAPAQYFYGSYVLRVGRTSECEKHMRQGRNADPLSVPASQLLAYCLSLLGRYDESLAEIRRAYDLDTSAAGSRGFAPLTLLHDGRSKEASALARVTVAPPNTGVGVAAYVLGVTGDRAGAAAMIHLLETHPRGEFSLATALFYAYLGLGDTTRAFSAMETAVRYRERPYIPLVDPMFDPVRKSPRFAAAVRGLGLDDRLFTTSR